MDTSATEFLEMWRAAFVHADEPTEDKEEDWFEECVRLAREEGVELDELNEAAGGDLKEYVCRAIEARAEKSDARNMQARRRRRSTKHCAGT